MLIIVNSRKEAATDGVPLKKGNLINFTKN